MLPHYTCALGTPRGIGGLVRQTCQSKLTTAMNRDGAYVTCATPLQYWRSKKERIHLRWSNVGTWPRLSTSGMAPMRGYPAEQVWRAEMGIQNQKNITGVWNADERRVQICGSYLPRMLRDARRLSCDGAHVSVHDRRIDLHLKNIIRWFKVLDIK